MIELNKIYNEDCLTGMVRLDDKSIDLILCDLPFELTAPDWDKIIPLELLWQQYKRVIKLDGTIALFAAQPFTTKLINSNLTNFKYCWYWIKNQGTNFFHAENMPIRKVEEICIFYNGKYFPQKTDGHIPTRSAIGCTNGQTYFDNKKRDYIGGSTERYPTNILDFKCVDNYHRSHPAQKPVQLLEYIITTYTKENEIILDNCMGSGSTAIAALNTNRQYIGFELDETYFNIAEDRIKNHIINNFSEGLF